MSIRYEPATALTTPALAALFNAGYAGYLVPVNVNAAYIETHIQQQDVSLEHSWVAYDGNEPVGFAFLAIRDKRGWVAGIGVVPGHRQQGIGRGLMMRLIETARQARLRQVQLEVIVGNDAAHALYLAVGFRDTRRLLVLERQPAELEPVRWSGSIEQGNIDRALAVYDRLHTTENPWQRQPESLVKTAAIPQTSLAVSNGVVEAYVIGHFSDKRLAINDVGVNPKAPDALAALLTTLHSGYPQASGRLVNLDEGDPASAVLQALGYVTALSQHEMRIDI